MKLLLMWLVGVPALVATMVMASRMPVHASLPSARQARVSFVNCSDAGVADSGSRQICRNMY